MKELFLCFILVYIVILVLRFYLTQSYFRKNTALLKNTDLESYLNLKEVTIFQPILSGDKFLEEKLSYIYDNLDEAQLIWAINKEDQEAERIVNKIINKNLNKSVYIKKCDDSPFNENPKVYKIISTMEKWRKYVVILDDDTIIDIQRLKEIEKKILDKNIVTGIPYYLKSDSFYGNLVRAYVNSNSIYNYFTFAKLKKNKTINGMFYIFKSEKVKSMNFYEKIKFKLCDDYEFAKIAEKNGLGIYQSVIPCKINTEVNSFGELFRLMRRWHIFINHYIKENFDVNIFLFSVVPFMSGIFLILLSIAYKFEVFLLYIFILFINSIFSQKLRRKIFRESEGLKDIILEIFSNILQIFYWISSLIKSDQIIWRKKIIKIKNGEMKIVRDEKKDKN